MSIALTISPQVSVKSVSYSEVGASTYTIRSLIRLLPIGGV